MLSGDLLDLEREMAKLTTGVFEKTGLSYPWGQIEEGMDSSLPNRRVLHERAFPSETASVFSRIEDRRKIVGKLMSRSPSWEEQMSHILGGVSFLQVGGQDLPEALRGTQDDRIAQAFGADENGRVMLGTPSNPWRELEGKPIPFIDPIFLESLFDEMVDDEDIHMTPTYRDLKPWLFNDVDEKKVAQWHHDVTGLPLWAGSWMQYQIASKAITEDSVPEIKEVKSRVLVARAARAKLFGVELSFAPRQLNLW